MKKLMLICICCLCLGSALWAQSNSAATRGVLGYLDPSTGAFRPVPPQAHEDAEQATATFTGTIKLTLTLTLKTTTLTNVTCSMQVSVIDSETSSPTFYNELGAVAATGSGATRTCNLSIPYSWVLATQSTDTMTISYGATGNTGTTPIIDRSTNRDPLSTQKVPANGATTTLTAAATL